MSKEYSLEELNDILYKEQIAEADADIEEFEQIKKRSRQAVIDSHLPNEVLENPRPTAAYLARKYYPPIKSEIPSEVRHFSTTDTVLIMLEAFGYHLIAIAILFYIALFGI
tara:strand:+ start:405 stop:737 length:333 start_codon:yes stop_codon:yes gene_type:complete